MTRKPPKPSRNHHFVPRSTLRRFSIGGDRRRVWVYDKTKGRAFTTAIENAGSRNDFNKLVRSDGEVANFESLFDAVDATLAKIGDLLVKHRSLAGMPESVRLHLADGAAVQHLRTPLLRSTYQDVPRRISAMLQDKGLPPLGPEAFPTDNDARRLSVRMILDRERLRAALVDKDLVLMTPRGGARFWTSDNPVVRMSTAPDGDTGFEAKGVQIYLPIADDLVLGFFCKSHLAGLMNLPLEVMNISRAMRSELVRWREGLLNGQPVALSDVEVRNLNALQVTKSSRFVYAAENSFDLADEILRTTPSARLVESDITLGRMGEGPGPSRNVPEGKILALYGRSRVHLVPLSEWDPDDRSNIASTDLPRLLDDVLTDRPFTKAEFYLDRHALSMVGGGVDVEILSTGRLIRFRVVHSDPALRHFDDQVLRGEPKRD